MVLYMNKSDKQQRRQAFNQIEITLRYASKCLEQIKTVYKKPDKDLIEFAEHINLQVKQALEGIAKLK